jgi:hypothetical protein
VLSPLTHRDHGSESHLRHVCMLFFCACVVLCIGIGLVFGRCLVLGVLSTVHRIEALKDCQSWIMRLPSL